MQENDDDDYRWNQGRHYEDEEDMPYAKMTREELARAAERVDAHMRRRERKQ